MKISKKNQKEEDYPVEDRAQTAVMLKFRRLQPIDSQLAPGAKSGAAIQNNFRLSKGFRESGESIPRIRLERGIRIIASGSLSVERTLEGGKEAENRRD